MNTKTPLLPVPVKPKTPAGQVDITGRISTAEIKAAGTELWNGDWVMIMEGSAPFRIVINENKLVLEFGWHPDTATEIDRIETAGRVLEILWPRAGRTK